MSYVLEFISSVKKEFDYYKLLGEKTIEQLDDDQIKWQYNEESNSVAILVKHLWGTMLSRWTDFLTTDGEKEWRNRDAEFVNDIKDKKELLQKWEAGWQCLFNALDSINDENFETIVYIRNGGHTVMEAVLRQQSHYIYHVGQIVSLGKMICGPAWKPLSIPRGASVCFNKNKFSQPHRMAHFTDEVLHKKG